MKLTIKDGILWACLLEDGETEVVLPNGVKTIGILAFEGCVDLTSVVIPGSVKEICDWTFKNCSCLTSVVIEDGVEEISDRVFGNCTELTSVVIPDSVKKIGWIPFDGCNLKKLIIHALSGSYAEQYAKEEKIRFEAIEK